MVTLWVGKEGRFGEQSFFAFYGQSGRSEIKEILKGSNVLFKLSRILS